MTAPMQPFRRALFGAALLFGLFAAPGLHAQGPGGGGGMMADPATRAQTRVTLLTERLALTPAQAEQVKAIVLKQYTEQQTMMAARMQGGGGDMAAMRAEMQKQRTALDTAIDAVLTEQQKPAYKKLVEEEDARRAARMQQMQR